MKEVSKKIATLSTEEVSLMTGPVKHYYEDRAKEGFTFDDQLQDDVPAQDGGENNLLNPNVSDSQSNTSS